MTSQREIEIELSQSAYCLRMAAQILKLPRLRRSRGLPDRAGGQKPEPPVADGAAMNRIIHGDCREVLKTLPSESVDFVLTDPPYFVRYKDRTGRSVRNDGAADAGRILGAFDDIHRVLKPDSLCVSFYGWQAIDAFMLAWKAAGFTPVGHIVWRKSYASSERFCSHRPRTGIRAGQGPAAEADDADRRRAAVGLFRQPLASRPRKTCAC